MADKSKFIDYIDDALEKSKETTLSQLFLTYQGIPYPVTMCTQETFRALDAFEARSDDVLLASYPKCGKADLSLRVHFGRRWERAKVGRRRFPHGTHWKSAGRRPGQESAFVTKSTTETA